MHTDSNDVFWMVLVADGAVQVDFSQQRASLRVTGLPVFDDHDIANSLTGGLGLPGGLGFSYPHIPPVAPARAIVSFDVEWNGATAMADINNMSQRFKGSFLQTNTTIEWAAEQPGFRFQSEPANPSRNLISVLGREQSGVFFGAPPPLESRLQYVACGAYPPTPSCQLDVNQWNWYLTNKIDPAAPVLMLGDGSQMMTAQQYVQARADAGLF
ncbi:MAG TPA: hypothetical protein VEU62_19210 [Bryobacterales bacterium]|nr:hypothetical protein [Bryobacterales bacterium]